jgi:DNA-binding NarL/FixJ family response regulator
MASLSVLAANPLLRGGLAGLMQTIGFGPVEAACDLEELKRQQGARPGLLVVSLQESDLEIASLMQEVRAWAPHVKVVFLASALDMPTLNACFACGANGYLLESISPDGLQHSLALVSAGENVFPSELATQFSATAAEVNDQLATLRNLHLSDRVQAGLSSVKRGLAWPFAVLSQLGEHLDGGNALPTLSEAARIEELRMEAREARNLASTFNDGRTVADLDAYARTLEAAADFLEEVLSRR